jgi:hypothetical protein
MCEMHNIATSIGNQKEMSVMFACFYAGERLDRAAFVKIDENNGHFTKLEQKIDRVFFFKK